MHFLCITSGVFERDGCVYDLARVVGLPVSREVISEPFAEGQEHDLNGQRERRILGKPGARRCVLL